MLHTPPDASSNEEMGFQSKAVFSFPKQYYCTSTAFWSLSPWGNTWRDAFGCKSTCLHSCLKDTHHHYGLLKAILFSSRSNSSNKENPHHLLLQNHGLQVQSFNISLLIKVVSSLLMPHTLHSYYLKVIFLQDSLYPQCLGKEWTFTGQSKSCNQQSISIELLQIVAFFTMFTLKEWPEPPPYFITIRYMSDQLKIYNIAQNPSILHIRRKKKQPYISNSTWKLIS